MSPNGTPFANTATPNIAGFYMGMVKCERKVGNIVKWCHQLYNCLRKDCTNISRLSRFYECRLDKNGFGVGNTGDELH